MPIMNQKQLSELIGGIYDAALDPRLWQHVMTNIREAFGGKGSMFLIQDLDQPRQSVVDFYGIKPDFEEEVLHRREQEDYWYLGSIKQKAGTTILGSKLIDYKEMRSTAFYNDIVRYLDIEYMVGGVIQNGPDRQAILSFLRSKKAGNFTEEYERILATLIPHVQKAFFIQRQLADKVSFEAALSESPYGTVILDTNKQPLLINKLAEQFFLEEDGLTLRFGSLKFWDYTDQLAFDQTINRIINPPPSKLPFHGATISVRRCSGKLPYQVVITPLNQRSTEIALNEGAACLVFIHDPTITPSLSSKVLIACYGLTSAESVLCELLFSGNTLEEACESLEITRNTAKTHLKHIFDKCGVNSQAALMKLLALGLK